jgi:anti-sigma regulatory factor (Ser/Thr protein kinase)
LLADPGAPRTAGAYELAPGATIVLYTDGLIERRTRPLDDGLAALRAAVNAAPHDNVERLADLVLGAMTADGGSADDAALLCVRLQPPFSAELTADPVALRSVRADVATWLRAGGVPEPVADDVVLAVHEATANAVEHAYAEAEPNGVSVSLWRDADGAVRAEIRDRGRWRTGGSEPARGRGLPLMSALMDDVAVRHEADGTTVTMGLRPQNEEDR